MELELLLHQKDVYIHSSTLDCILNHKCVVCLYKFIPKQAIKKARDVGRIILPHNLRPETCPRSTQRVVEVANSPSPSSTHCGLYRHKDYLLTLGDGDFSFSLSLVHGHHRPDRLYATSYESLQSITSIYQNCDSILQTLSSSGVQTFHDVDAANIAATIAIPKAHFDVVVWNFPCIAAITAGSDGQVTEIEANKTLLRKFFSNVGQFLKVRGRREVHITHKTIEPFSWWGLTDIAVECGWIYRGSLIFDRYVNCWRND